MATKPALFRQSDVRRALKAATDLGLYINRYRISQDGSIEVFPSTDPVGKAPTEAQAPLNPFDERFK